MHSSATKQVQNISQKKYNVHIYIHIKQQLQTHLININV